MYEYPSYRVDQISESSLSLSLASACFVAEAALNAGLVSIFCYWGAGIVDFILVNTVVFHLSKGIISLNL